MVNDKITRSTGFHNIIDCDYIGNLAYSYGGLSLKVIVFNRTIIGWSIYVIYDVAIIIVSIYTNYGSLYEMKYIFTFEMDVN